jgi:hypothetical protein
MVCVIPYKVHMYAVLILRSSRSRVDPHGHGAAVGAYTAHGPEAEFPLASTSGDHNDHGHSDPEKVAKGSPASHAHSAMGDSKQASPLSDENAMAQLIGVAILEFGVILHRHVLCFRVSAYYSTYR